jgi:hypothetical protein
MEGKEEITDAAGKRLAKRERSTSPVMVRSSMVRFSPPFILPRLNLCLVGWPLLTQPLVAQVHPKVEQDRAMLERLRVAEAEIDESFAKVDAARAAMLVAIMHTAVARLASGTPEMSAASAATAPGPEAGAMGLDYAIRNAHKVLKDSFRGLRHGALGGM